MKDMLEQEIVRPSCSPWASPVVMVKKKDGTLRFCIDFRKLNEVTVKEAHSLPKIDDTLEASKGTKIFSTLDLKSGYWQVPVKEEHKSKTAFWTSSGQLFEFNRLPFELCNAPATFSRLMDNVLSGLPWEVCLYYLDDVIVFSKDWEEHVQRLKMVLSRLRDANLRLGHKQCTLAKRSVTFLGYLVSEDVLQTDPRLLDRFQEIQPPANVSQVRSFPGLVGYYRHFIKGFSSIAAPLNRLWEKNKPFEWTEKCMATYKQLKTLLLKRPMVTYPDFSVLFRLYTDASNVGVRVHSSSTAGWEGAYHLLCQSNTQQV